MVSPEQRIVAWWQTTLFLPWQSLPITQPHMHALSQAIPQTAKTELSLMHLLYVFALVPFTLPASHTWPLPFSLYHKPGPR